MRQIKPMIALIAIAVACTWLLPLSAAAVSSYAPIVKKASPSVVNIYTREKISSAPKKTNSKELSTRKQYFIPAQAQAIPQPVARRYTLGSGVIMSDKGYILTNYHVVKNAQQVLVTLADGRKVRAKIVGFDKATDLAVLKIDLKDLKAIDIGNSDNLQVGDIVLAIGNPFGLGQTVTQGIISAIGRSSIGINSLENYIQTDAAINPGNSGGALINMEGQFIGLNTAIYSRSGGYQGVGFAIPANVAVNVLQQIVRYGEVKRGWLGLEVRKLGEALAELYGTKEGRGVVILKVIRGSAADKAGLQAGDVIVALNRQPITSTRNFFSYVAQLQPGSKVVAHVIRDRKPDSIIITVGTRPKQQAVSQQMRDRNDGRFQR